MDLQLIISTMPTTFSKTTPSFLQLSRQSQKKPDGELKSEIVKFLLELKISVFSGSFTYDDGVNFALNLEGGVVTAEDVHHLF